jgi:hypothetical protein
MYLQTPSYIYLLLSERIDRTCVQRWKETSTTGHTNCTYDRRNHIGSQELFRPHLRKTHMRKYPVGSPRWVRVSIPIGVVLFLFALAGSAFLIPQLRILHVLQAMIYVAIFLLARRNSPWGFGIGAIIPTAWNCLNLFVTHLFQEGIVQLWSLIRTGRVSRPDTLTVMIGGMAHFLLIAACLAGFLQLRPRAKQWSQFFGGGLLALAYFAVIIAVAAPR